MSAAPTQTQPVTEPNDQPQTPNPETPKEEPKFTQAQLDAIVRDRLDREKTQREKAEQRAREEAEAKSLVDQQKYRELAEQQAKKITELEARAGEVETAQSQAERYKTALSSILETQRASIPAPIISLLDRMDPVEQLEWIAANQDAVAPQRAAGGIPPSPRGQAAPLPSDEQLVQDERRKRRQTGIYGI